VNNIEDNCHDVGVFEYFHVCVNNIEGTCHFVGVFE
jgi:hypothetical protein